MSCVDSHNDFYESQMHAVISRSRLLFCEVCWIPRMADHVFPVVTALPPMQGHANYHARMREDCKAFVGVVDNAQPWGEFEGTPALSDAQAQCMWQTRTQFSGVRQDWTTMAPELSSKVEAAYQSDPKGYFEFSIKGSTFVISFRDMEQKNKEYPDRIRTVQRLKAEMRDWWVVEVEVGKDGAPQNLAQQSAMIDSGLGERKQQHGAVLYTVPFKGNNLYVDIQQEMAYRSLEAGAMPLRMVSIPRSISNALSDKSGELRPESALYQRLVKMFEDTKWGKLKSSPTLHKFDDVHIISIKYYIRQCLMVQFFEKLKRMGKDCRLCLVYHGTKAENRNSIINNNFSTNKDRKRSSGNKGWFGDGTYFGRRAFTALGYGGINDELLCCLVTTAKPYQVPSPDSSDNDCHGKELKAGYDAHISPSGKELVIDNPRQILPCFVLKFNKQVQSAGASQYEG